VINPNNFTFDIHQKMRENNVLLAFTGEFDMKIINALITSVKLKLVEVEEAARIQKKVYNVMVDCLETIFHSYETAQRKNASYNSFSIFTLSRDAGFYYLISGNYIFNDTMEARKKQIDKINALNTDGKKALFRDYIVDDTIADQDSDLAMLNIAIKSGNVLGYEFKKVDANNSFYIFQVKIKIL